MNTGNPHVSRPDSRRRCAAVGMALVIAIAAAATGCTSRKTNPACRLPNAPAPTATRPIREPINQGGPAQLDVVTADNVIHTADGRLVTMPLPNSAQVTVLRRVHGGWVIAHQTNLHRSWAAVPDDGHLLPITGRTNVGMLDVSPEGDVVAVEVDDGRLEIQQLPTLTPVASLTLSPEHSAGSVGLAFFAGGGRLLINTVGPDNGAEARRWLLTLWDWRSGRVASRANLIVKSTVGDLAVLSSVNPADTDLRTADPTLARVSDALEYQRVGCLPPGSWALSPDGLRLASLCGDSDRARVFDRPSACVIALADLLAGRQPAVTRVHLPLMAAELTWANDLDLHVTAIRFEVFERGLLRCSVVEGTCAQEILPDGPLVVALEGSWHP